MSQKSRRSKTKYRAGGKSAKSKTGKTAHPVSSVSSVSKAPMSTVGTSLSPVQETARYKYLMPELKRIGIIAGSLLLVLVVLAFVLG